VDKEVPQKTVDCYSEFLPTADYAPSLTGGELNFRVTARDGDVNGGGTAFDDVTLTVDPAGPFEVTSLATVGQAVQGGSEETVTWAVNGTDAPTLAPNVRILLSTDGGLTYPQVLAASTPNDGSEAVTVPDVETTQARIKVEAVDNYFFDVNDATFTIQAGPVEPDVEAPTTRITDGPGANSYVLDRKAGFRFAGTDDTVSYACSLDGRDVDCADGAVTVRRLSTGPHVFRVAARDAAGNVDQTPAKRRFISPYNDRQLDRRGDWDGRKARSAYRRTWLRADTKGASLTRRLDDVRKIALVVGKKRGYGSLAVYFRGRRVDTVSLDGRARGKVVVPVAKFRKPRSGMLRIVTLNGRTVRVEGLGAG
jgi:hypothetical protein